MNHDASLQRRRRLAGLLKLLLLLGGVALAIPFLASISQFDADESEHTTLSGEEVQLPNLAAGELYRFAWRGVELAIYFRTERDVQNLVTPVNELSDPDSTASDQPANMKNAWRSADKHYFVFFPYENRKRCLVQLHEASDAVFSEPCFGARYDAAGRVFKNSGHHSQTNLAVPPHTLVGNKLRLGAWQPNMRQ